ncbi:MAG: hypothetical protein LBB05_04315, partial [Puniceicoccales bacterium]|nr:hypothetical protein [Puniceicoccales bacterium]
MGIRVDPKEYMEGTLGAMAPDLLDPADPRNNPFNPDKTFSFYEIEMNIGEDTGMPLAKPDHIENPGNVPSAFSKGISDLPQFSPPQTTKGIVNDLFPKFTEPVIEGLPRPRESAIDRNYIRNIDALPSFILHPVDEALTAKDGPGLSELEFKTSKPAAPNPEHFIWDNPASEQRNLTRENVEWLTFLAHDTFFSDAGYQISTQLLSADHSLRERLTNPTLQREDSIWKNTTEDFLKEIVFAPDLPRQSNGSQLSWAEIVAYVNYYMVRDYCRATQSIYINDDKISLDDDATDIEKRDGIESTPLYYLRDLIAGKTSALLYKDKISAIDLSDATISYNVRKILGNFFVKKIQNSLDSETVADALCRDLLMIGLSTTLKSLQTRTENLVSDDEIKDEISQKIETYLSTGAVDGGITVKCGGSDNIEALAGQVFDDFVSKGYFDVTDKTNTLNAIRSEIRKLFLSLVSDLVLREARKYKLQCQINQIDRYLNMEFSDDVKLTDTGDPLSTEQFQISQKALKYVKSQLILLKNENHLPAELTVDDLIIDYKPVVESHSVFKNVTDYLNGETFTIKQYIDRRVREPLMQAVHTVLINEFRDSKIRNAIKKIFPMVDNAAQGEREKLRYALSGNFLPDLELYIVNRLLDEKFGKPTDSITVIGEDFITSLNDGSLINSNLDDIQERIKAWINEGLESFLSGGADDATKKELEGKYAFIKDTAVRANAGKIIQEILHLSEDTSPQDSSLVTAIEKQISEETLVLATKDKVEAQLQSLRSIILGEKIVTINGFSISAINTETEKFLEYTYAKILKDHYEPIIYNDFVKFTKLLGGWFGTAKARNSKDVGTLLMEKIEELRTNYGVYYDAIQSFQFHGEAYVFEDGTSHRHPKLDNQYDLFSVFFKADRSALNISGLLIDYIHVYEKYGAKCYKDQGKYDISDYSVELTNLLEKYNDLANGNDIFAEAILQGIRSEQIVLKRELEIIDLLLEYIKANNFRKELNTYLLDETITGWRSDAVKRQVLVNKIYSMAIDHGIMRTMENGLYGSGTVDASVTSLDGEKEYNEEAEAYLYAKGIVEYVDTGYDPSQDINIPVAEILNAIEAYRTSGLYDNGELLSQFKQLLVSCEHIPYTDGTSLFSQLTKYISSNSIDFSLLTLFANVYPLIKSDTYIPKGVEDLASSISDSAKTDIQNQMKSVYRLVNQSDDESIKSLNGIFKNFIDPRESDRYTTLYNDLNGLASATKTFEDGGGYAYTVNKFVDAYNVVSAGLKGLVNPSNNLITTLKNADSSTADDVFTQIKNALDIIRADIDAINIDATCTGNITNEANLRNAIEDLLTILDHIEVAFFLEKAQKKYSDWYVNREGGNSSYERLKAEFASLRPSLGIILNGLIKFLEDSGAVYSLISSFESNLLPLKGNCDEATLKAILPSWEADGENSLKIIFTQADYNPETKFETYGTKFSALNETMANLVNMGSVSEAGALKDNINTLQPIELLSSDFDSTTQNTVEKDYYVYLFNKIASAYNEAVALLKGTTVGIYINIFKLDSINATDAITSFQDMHSALSGLEEKFKTEYMASIQNGVQIGDDPANKLTDLAASHGQVILQQLLQILQQNKQMTLSNLLTKLYPSWKSQFIPLNDLRTALRSFVDREELGNVEDRKFTLTKADALSLLDAIDRTAYDVSFSSVLYTSTPENGTLKGIVGGAVKTENPSQEGLVPENGPYFTDVQNLPRELKFESLYDAIGTIAATGLNPAETVSSVAEIAHRNLEQVDEAYDRSRWLMSQFVLAHNKIVSDFGLENNPNLNGLDGYKTAFTNLSKSSTDVNKADLINSYNDSLNNLNLHNQINEICLSINTAQTTIQGLTTNEGDNLLDSNGTPNWANLSMDDVSTTITLNDQLFRIKKFKDNANSTEFYVVKNTIGANTFETFLTSNDVGKLQSLITAELELYQSFNNQVVLNIVDQLGSYNGNDYAASDFLTENIIDTTGNIFTTEFNNQVSKLVGQDNLSLLAIYGGVYAYGIQSKIEAASATFKGLLDAENFWQLAEDYVFNAIEVDVETKTVGELEYSEETQTAVKENYIEGLKSNIYKTLTRKKNDSDTQTELDTILTNLCSAIATSNNNDQATQINKLNRLFTELLKKISEATFDGSDVSVLLQTKDTGLPDDITITITNEDQAELGIYANQILANFRYQVVDELRRAFANNELNELKSTVDQLGKLKELLCSIIATVDLESESSSIYLFGNNDGDNDKNTTNSYVFYDENETEETDPGMTDLLIQHLTEEIDSLQTQNADMATHPASTYFLQKAEFDYDTWVAIGDDTDIIGAVNLFVEKFASVTYGANGIITSFGADIIDWDGFWAQNADGNDLKTVISSAYSGFDDNGQKAFQYSFLKALDGITNKDHFSSNNKNQLKYILANFDLYCLEIEDNTIEEKFGFLKQIDNSESRSDTPFGTALDSESGEFHPEEAHYVWNNDAINEIRNEIVKYPGSGTVNPPVYVSTTENLMDSYDERYANAYWKYVVNTYAYNLFIDNNSTMEAMRETLESLTQSLKTNGYSTEDMTQKGLFQDLKTQYDAFLMTFSWNGNSSLSADDLRVLGVSDDWIGILQNRSVSDEEKNASVDYVNNLILPNIREQLRYIIVSALATPDDDEKLAFETIRNALNDGNIKDGIFPEYHEIFTLLGIFDGTIEIATSQSLPTILSSVATTIDGYQLDLRDVFNATTQSALTAALNSFTNYNLAETKTTVDNALTSNEPADGTPRTLQQRIVGDRLENIQAILSNFESLKNHVKLCTDESYLDYQDRVADNNEIGESEWNQTIAGILAEIRKESSPSLETLKTFSTRLNNALGRNVTTDDNPTDPEVIAAMEDILNCSAEIEKLLLLSVLLSESKEIVQKFLCGEEASSESEEAPYSGISAFDDKTSALTFNEVLTLAQNADSTGISSTALLGNRIQKVADLIDSTHVGTSLKGIFTEASQEIQYVYNLSEISKALLGSGSQQNEFLNALNDFSNEIFSNPSSWDDITTQTIENLALTDINKNNENHSLSILVEAYNEAVSFFQSDALIKADVLTAIQPKITDFITAYDATNPSAYATQKEALQTSLASAEGLLTIFKTVFNSSGLDQAPAYREVLSIIHCQLRLKIDEEIQKLKNSYSCVEKSDPSDPLNTSYYVDVTPITWDESQITAHNAYINHLIEHLYRFEAMTYLGIFSKFNQNAVTREEMAMFRFVFGHWEELETADEELCEKYLSTAEVNALKILLHKAYIAQNTASEATLGDIFQSIYPKNTINDIDLSNIKGSINTNLKNEKFEVFSGIFNNYRQKVEQCIYSLYTEFQKYIRNGATPQITTISKISLDKLLHDLQDSAELCVLIKGMESFVEAINGKISALNTYLTLFVAEPTQEKLDDINTAFGEIINAINGKISSASYGCFQNCLNEIKVAFEQAQPQYYLLLLEKLYPNLATNETQRLNLKEAFSGAFPNDSYDTADQTVKDVINNIKGQIAVLFSNFGQDESLQKYYEAHRGSTFGQALTPNVNKLNSNVVQNANANFQQLTYIKSKFKELHRLLWYVLKPPTNTTAEQAIKALQELAGTTPIDSTATGSDAEDAKTKYDQLTGIYNAIREKLGTAGSDSFAQALNALIAGDYVSIADYKDTNICEKIKAIIDAIKQFQNDTITDMFKAFNAACFMVFLQKKYPYWNSDETQLTEAKEAYSDICEDILGNGETSYYTCGDTANVQTLLEKIKPYQGDLKIVDSRPHYFTSDSSSNCMQAHRVDGVGWLYREPAEKEGYIQYDVQQNKQYILSNGQYFELVEQEVAFVQLSPEQHVRILTPHILYEQSGGGYRLTADKVTQPVSENAVNYYVLGEDGTYYNIKRYHLKYKVYDGDNIKYIDLHSNDTFCYRATLRGYAEVASKDFPDLKGPLANDRDYFIIGDEGQYYKVDDVYTKYYYKEAELSDSESDNTSNTKEPIANGTYYKIVGETTDGCVLENGETVSIYSETLERNNTGVLFTQDNNGNYYLDNGFYYKIQTIGGELYIKRADGTNKKITASNGERYKISGYDSTKFDGSGTNENEAVKVGTQYYSLKKYKIVYNNGSSILPLEGNLSSLSGKTLYVLPGDISLSRLEASNIVSKGGVSMGTSLDIYRSSLTPFYRSTQNEKKFFGMKLYQWGVGEKYIARDDPYLVIPVTYERYVRNSENPEGFTAESKDVYIFSEVLNQYVLVGNTDAYYFTQGEKEYRVEFPDRRYVRQAVENSDQYLYVPHPESKYTEQSGSTAIDGDCIYANGKFLPIKQDDPGNGEPKINRTQKFQVKVNPDIDTNNDYVQASDGGYYPLKDVKIKTINGREFTYSTAIFYKAAETPSPLSIASWQPYALEEETYNNLFTKNTNQGELIRASEEGSTETCFVIPVKSVAGSYVHGENGRYYDVNNGSSRELYVDYDLVSDEGNWFVLQEDTLVQVDRKFYAKYSETDYKEIKTVGANETIKAGTKSLLPGNRYIEVSGNIIQIKDGEREYVKKSDNTYVPLKDNTGKVMVKKKVNVSGGMEGLNGILVANASDKKVVTEVKDKDLYIAKDMQVEGANGQLYNLNGMTVNGSESGSGPALDTHGLSNIFVKKSGTKFVRVSQPTEQYTVNENASGNFVKIGSKYYDRRRDDITLKVKYENEEGQMSYRTLNGNDTNIPIYLSIGDSKVQVKPTEGSNVSGSGLFEQYNVQANGSPTYTALSRQQSKAVRFGTQYYNLKDFQLVVKRNGKLSKFIGNLDELKSSNGVYMVPYLVPEKADLETYDAAKAIKVDRYYVPTKDEFSLNMDQYLPKMREYADRKNENLEEKDKINVDNLVGNFRQNGDYTECSKLLDDTLKDIYNSGNGKFEIYTITKTANTGYANSQTVNCYLKGTDNAFYGAKNLKVAIDGAYNDFLGFVYSEKASTAITSLSEDIFKNYEFIYSQDTTATDVVLFIKGDDGQYYAMKIGSDPQLYIGQGTTAIRGNYLFKVDDVSIPHPTQFIYVTENNLGDRIKIVNEYVKKSEISVNDPNAGIHSFFVNAYGKDVAVNDLVTLYKEANTGDTGTLCYQIDTDPGSASPVVYFGQEKKVTIDGTSGSYAPDPEGGVVRAETTGYYEWNAVKNDPNFIRLRDVYYVKRDPNEEVYFVSSLAMDTLYIYGTKYDFCTLDNVGDGLYYKYEGDFSTARDDQYCNSAAIQLRGTDGKLYKKDDLFQKGTQLEYVPVKDLAMIVDGSDEAIITDVYVKSFAQTLERVETLINNIDSDNSRALYGELGGKIREHLDAINGNLDTYSKAIAVYDQKGELGAVALQNHPEYRSDGSGALVDVFDEYTKRVIISTDEKWLNYYRGIRDEVEAYKVSSEEQNIFVQRLTSINNVLFNHFGNIVSHEEFWGGDLSLAVGKLVRQIEPTITPKLGTNPSATDRENFNTKLYETCYTRFEEMVTNLETLRLSWDLEDKAKEAEAQGVESVISPEMNTLKERLGETIKKLKEFTADKIKVIEAQVELYGKIMLLEYVYNNYGKIGNEIVFLNDTVQFQRTPGKIAVQFVKLSTGEHALRLCDYVRSNGADPLLGHEFLFRYNNTKGEIEKCVLDLASAYGSYTNNKWTTKDNSVIKAYSASSPYLFTVGSGEGGTSIECKWGKARSTVDASEWGVDGILFKDVIRHNALQTLFRYKEDGATTSTEGYIYTLAKAKLPKNDLMMDYVEQVTKNMEVPIYMARDRLCFFEMANYKTPAMIGMIQEKTQKLADEPASPFDPLNSMQVEFLNTTGLNEMDLHAATAITNVPESVILKLAPASTDDPNGWPQVNGSDSNQVQAGSLVSFLRD